VLQLYRAPSSEIEAPPRSPQLFIAVTLAAQLLWLSHTILRLCQTAPDLAQALERFGGKPPAVTAAFLACYRYAPLLLVLLGALAIDVSRRRSVSQAYAMALFGAISVSIWAWITWYVLAMYEPVRRIADAIR
jgi:hypothetical protein